MKARVIGGGLAGSEAAWQLAQAGIAVELVEMRPGRPTPAHHTGELAELVCSNSLGAAGVHGASGLLKAELELMDSLLMQAARVAAVPAGSALAVDRQVFARAVTERLMAHPLVEIVRAEITELDPAQPTVIASGPLTSPALAAALRSVTGTEHLHFYDAAAPIVTLESLDLGIIWRQARYDKGEGEYLNCPMDQAEYAAFHAALIAAEGAVLHLAEDARVNFFEGCLPVEVIAGRGLDTLRYGPLKPVGLRDPRTGRRPWAVVQLRQDTVAGDLFNLVGFQTQLKWGEQERVFRMIPGLQQAEFVRLGVMHRNTYLASPQLLEPTLQWKGQPRWFAAGCLVGVEGYTESVASGALAGRNLARVLQGQAPLTPPPMTMLGSLVHYVAHADPAHFQPINSNWGILEPLPERVRDKQDRHRLQAERALAAMRELLRD